MASKKVIKNVVFVDCAEVGDQMSNFLTYLCYGFVVFDSDFAVKSVVKTSFDFSVPSGWRYRF